MVVLQVSTWQDWTMFPRMTFLVCFCLVISLYKIWKAEVMEQLFCSSHTCHFHAGLPNLWKPVAGPTTPPPSPGSFYSFCDSWVHLFRSMVKFSTTSEHPHHSGQRQEELIQFQSVLAGSSLCLWALPRSLFLVSLTWDPSSLPDSWILSFCIRWKDNKLTETAS